MRERIVQAKPIKIDIGAIYSARVSQHFRCLLFLRFNWILFRIGHAPFVHHLVFAIFIRLTGTL